MAPLLRGAALYGSRPPCRSAQPGQEPQLPPQEHFPRFLSRRREAEIPMMTASKMRATRNVPTKTTSFPGVWPQVTLTSRASLVASLYGRSSSQTKQTMTARARSAPKTLPPPESTLPSW